MMGLRGVDMAVVQSDVLERARTDKSRPATGFSYIAPLWNEQFLLLARSNINAVTDLANRRVEVGLNDSGTNATMTRLFGLMNLPITPVNDSLDIALVKLLRGEVDAVALVAAKPVLVPPAISLQGGFHLLSIPPEKGITDVYKPAVLEASDYPSLIQKNDAVPTIAVGTVLIAANFPPNTDRYRNLEAFTNALFDGFDTLRAPGHAAGWAEVNLQADVPGLTRFPPAQSWIDHKANPSRNGPQDTKLLFSQFIEFRQHALGGTAISDQDKQALFEQFQHWQAAKGSSPQ